MDEGGPDAGHDDEAPHRDPVWRRVDILLVAVVPVLVLVMAAAGTWRYHQLDQTSWRGGTLGMFATVDTPSNRLVRGVTAEGAIELVPAGLREEATRTLVTPSD